MKYLVIILVVLLPLHALLITFLKCKLNIDTDILRFWKEIILIILFFVAFFGVMKRFKWNISKLYKNNYILWMITLFIFTSIIFIFLPYFQPKLSSFLWFKYDVFFLVALIIWLYLPVIKNNFNLILKSLFLIIWVILSIFVPWYMFWDISTITNIMWFSDKVSTYEANSCISFSQNVNWEHRFQWSFAWPIRWSVFLTIFYIIYLWFILKINNIKNINKKLLILIPSILIIISIFYSYSKTSALGLFFWLALFSYLSFKIKHWKYIPLKYIISIWTIIMWFLSILLIIKQDLFLHLGSVLNRLDNLKMSLEMFLYNPFGYGLWIAWPASWVGHSIESTGSWVIAVNSTSYTHKFLPENWYIQILLEQGIIWLTVFIGLLFVIWLKLFEIVKKKKDYLSIGIFTSFITLLFMANFTHAFEESATSYILFLIIWAYIAKHNLIKRKNITKQPKKLEKVKK